MSIAGRKKITIVFTVDAEFVPGMFYDPQDFATSTSKDILYRLTSYKPEIVSTDVQDVGAADEHERLHRESRERNEKI